MGYAAARLTQPTQSINVVSIENWNNVGALTTADFTGPVTVPSIFNLTPVATTVFYTGTSVTPQSAAVQSAVQGAIAGAIASVGDVANASFGTDSVSEQIANG